VSVQLPNPALLPPGALGGTQAPQANRAPAAPATNAGGQTFADVLAATNTSTVQAPHFSKHALDRLQRRGIDVDQASLQRLTDGINKAAAKGSRNSVVFVDNTAFVVSVANNTVVTAVGAQNMREHVFTNIDSAVIA
jgi:flagellar operon protein